MGHFLSNLSRVTILQSLSHSLFLPFSPSLPPYFFLFPSLYSPFFPPHHSLFPFKLPLSFLLTFFFLSLSPFFLVCFRSRLFPPSYFLPSALTYFPSLYNHLFSPSSPHNLFFTSSFSCIPSIIPKPSFFPPSHIFLFLYKYLPPPFPTTPPYLSTLPLHPPHHGTAEVVDQTGRNTLGNTKVGGQRRQSYVDHIREAKNKE